MPRCRGLMRCPGAWGVETGCQGTYQGTCWGPKLEAQHCEKNRGSCCFTFAHVADTVRRLKLKWQISGKRRLDCGRTGCLLSCVQSQRPVLCQRIMHQLTPLVPGHSAFASGSGKTQPRSEEPGRSKDLQRPRTDGTPALRWGCSQPPKTVRDQMSSQPIARCPAPEDTAQKRPPLATLQTPNRWSDGAMPLRKGWAAEHQARKSTPSRRHHIPTASDS